MNIKTGLVASQVARCSSASMRPSAFNLRLVASTLAADPSRLSGWHNIPSADEDLRAWLAEYYPEAPTDFVRRLRTRLRPDLVADQPGFTTNDIVDVMTAAWQVMHHQNPSEFVEWQREFDEFCTSDACRHIVPSKIIQSLPFRDDVSKLIYGALTGRMPFSREYVLRHYELNHCGKPYVLFPSNSTAVKRLVVFFSGHSGRKTYNRYSWYWDESEQWSSDTARLFLCDEESHWYVGQEGKQDIKVWSEIIISTIKRLKLSPNQVITVGGSMGGYGAIRYAIELNLHAAFAVNPQLDLRAALRYKEDSWEKKILESGTNFRSIADAVYRQSSCPIIYLEHGRAACDLSGVSEVLQAVRDVGGTVIERTVNSYDHQTANPTRDHIDALIDFIERFDVRT